MAQPDPFRTVPEVADRLRLSERRVRELIADRQLTAVRVGTRGIRVPQSALDAFIANRTTEALSA